MNRNQDPTRDEKQEVKNPKVGLLDYEDEERKNKQNLDRMINNFSEEDPQIRKLILDNAGEFSNNPRDLKRFINVFRFHYFLLLARQAQRFSTLPLEQLTRWIILFLKWPDVIRWLQGSVGENEYSSNYVLESGVPTTLTGYRLMQLENLGKTCKDLTEWQKRAREDLKLKVDAVPWLTDESLRRIFEREGNLVAEKRLSHYAGRGLY
jgi:hypothetical protein